MAITISGFTWAKRHKRHFPAVITIEDPRNLHGLRFHRTPHPAHLVLRFVDLDDPLPEPFSHHPFYQLATVAQINHALSFACEHEDLLIHCQAGIARSTAVALGVLMQRLNDEDKAFAALRDIRPEAMPNRHVLRVVDQLLQSHLNDRLDAWDQHKRRSSLRRQLCRKAYFIEAGLALDADLQTISMMDWSKSLADTAPDP